MNRYSYEFIIAIIIYIILAYICLPEIHEVIIVDAGNESIIIASDTWISYNNKTGEDTITVEGPVDPTKIIINGQDINSFEVIWTKNNVTFIRIFIYKWDICKK